MALFPRARLETRGVQGTREAGIWAFLPVRRPSSIRSGKSPPPGAFAGDPGGGSHAMPCMIVPALRVKPGHASFPPSGHEGSAGAREAPRMNCYVALCAPRFGFMRCNFDFSALLYDPPGLFHSPDGGQSVDPSCSRRSAVFQAALPVRLVVALQTRPPLSRGGEAIFCTVPPAAAARASGEKPAPPDRARRVPGVSRAERGILSHRF